MLQPSEALEPGIGCIGARQCLHLCSLSDSLQQKLIPESCFTRIPGENEEKEASEPLHIYIVLYPYVSMYEIESGVDLGCGNVNRPFKGWTPYN